MNEIDPIYLFPIFIAGWLGITSLISLLGGWFWLARKFPFSNDIGSIIQSFSWKSLNLNYLAGYSSCINIKITEKGLILKPSLLFSALHKPIFLTWTDISDLELKNGFFKKLSFHAGKSRIVIYGKVAVIIQSVFFKYK